MDPVYGRPDQIKLIAEAQALRAQAMRMVWSDTLSWLRMRRAR